MHRINFFFYVFILFSSHAAAQLPMIDSNFNHFRIESEVSVIYKDKLIVIPAEQTYVDSLGGRLYNKNTASLIEGWNSTLRKSSAIFDDGRGGYYLTGAFSEVQGHQSNYIVRLDSNGKVDMSFVSPFRRNLYKDHNGKAATEEFYYYEEPFVKIVVIDSFLYGLTKNAVFYQDKQYSNGKVVKLNAYTGGIDAIWMPDPTKVNQSYLDIDKYGKDLLVARYEHPTNITDSIRLNLIDINNLNIKKEVKFKADRFKGMLSSSTGFLFVYQGPYNASIRGLIIYDMDDNWKDVSWKVNIDAMPLFAEKVYNAVEYKDHVYISGVFGSVNGDSTFENFVVLNSNNISIDTGLYLGKNYDPSYEVYYSLIIGDTAYVAEDVIDTNFYGELTKTKRLKGYNLRSHQEVWNNGFSNLFTGVDKFYKFVGHIASTDFTGHRYTLPHKRILFLDTATLDITGWINFNGERYPIIRTMLLIGDKLYFSGDFDSVENKARAGLACYDMSKQEITSWNPTLANVGAGAYQMYDAGSDKIVMVKGSAIYIVDAVKDSTIYKRFAHRRNRESITSVSSSALSDDNKYLFVFGPFDEIYVYDGASYLPRTDYTIDDSYCYDIEADTFTGFSVIGKSKADHIIPDVEHNRVRIIYNYNNDQFPGTPSFKPFTEVYSFDSSKLITKEDIPFLYDGEYEAVLHKVDDRYYIRYYSDPYKVDSRIVEYDKTNNELIPTSINQIPMISVFSCEILGFANGWAYISYSGSLDVWGFGPPDPVNYPNSTSLITVTTKSWHHTIFKVRYAASHDISGVVFNDINNNGVRDSGENTIPNVKVTLDGLTDTAYTNNDGRYKFYRVQPGSYTLKAQGDMLSGIFTVDTTSGGDVPINNVDIPVNVNVKRDLKVLINMKSKDLTYINIDLINGGSVTEYGKLTVVLNSGYETNKFGFEPVADYVSNDTVIWEFDSINAYEKKEFKFRNFFTAGSGLAIVSAFTDHPDSLFNGYTRDSFMAEKTGIAPTRLKSILLSKADRNGYLSNKVEWIDYRVEFSNQNDFKSTGLVIVDTLDSAFNVSTFELLNSSFNCSYTIDGNVVTINSDDVFKERTNNNTHFVKYRVKLKAGITDGTIVTNTAHVGFKPTWPTPTNKLELKIYDCDSLLNNTIEVADEYCTSPKSFYFEFKNVLVSNQIKWYVDDIEKGNRYYYQTPQFGVGTHKVKVEVVTKGCGIVSKEVDINIYNGSVKPAVQLYGDSPICVGNVLRIQTSQPNINYQWYKDGVSIGSADSYNITQSGMYYYSSNVACHFSSDTINVVFNPIPPKPTINQSGNELISSSPFVNLWYKNGSGIAGSNNEVYTVTSDGYYQVEVKDTSTGCTNISDSLFVQVVSVYTLYNEVKFVVYPNPFDDITTLQIIGYNGTGLTYTLTDLTGRVIKNGTVVNNEATIHRDGITAGVYYLILKDNNSSVMTIKLIID